MANNVVKYNCTILHFRLFIFSVFSSSLLWHIGARSRHKGTNNFYKGREWKRNTTESTFKAFIYGKRLKIQIPLCHWRPWYTFVRAILRHRWNIQSWRSLNRQEYKNEIHVRELRRNNRGNRGQLNIKSTSRDVTSVARPTIELRDFTPHSRQFFVNPVTSRLSEQVSQHCFVFHCWDKTEHAVHNFLETERHEQHGLYKPPPLEAAARLYSRIRVAAFTGVGSARQTSAMFGCSCSATLWSTPVSSNRSHSSFTGLNECPKKRHPWYFS